MFHHYIAELLAKAEMKQLDEAERAALKGDRSKMRAYHFRMFLILCLILTFAAYAVYVTVKSP